MANEQAVQKINVFKGGKARNLILLGSEKEQMTAIAKELAAKWLKTSEGELTFHPDYKYIEADNCSILSEQAEIIREMSEFIPTSDCSVCIIKDAETMTVELQNKLLKVLEDRESRIALIFVTAGPLIDTVASRCATIEFSRLSLTEMYSSDRKCIPALLGCDGSVEMYEKIVKDEWFLQYLEGFYKSFIAIKERSALRNILRLTHALREKDEDYLPDRLDTWQMQVFLCMIRQIFWYVMLNLNGLTVPVFVRLGTLYEIYTLAEADLIYRKSEEYYWLCQKKGGFNKNDFFDLLLYMIPCK